MICRPKDPSHFSTPSKIFWAQTADKQKKKQITKGHLLLLLNAVMPSKWQNLSQFRIWWTEKREVSKNFPLILRPDDVSSTLEKVKPFSKFAIVLPWDPVDVKTRFCKSPLFQTNKFWKKWIECLVFFFFFSWEQRRVNWAYKRGSNLAKH